MNFSKAHFIGIAGKGMSATALLLRQMGVQITGSDEGFYPPVSDYLKNEKIPFAEGYRKENIPDDADVIVIGKKEKKYPTERLFYRERKKRKAPTQKQRGSSRRDGQRKAGAIVCGLAARVD